MLALAVLYFAAVQVNSGPEIGATMIIGRMRFFSLKNVLLMAALVCSWAAIVPVARGQAGDCVWSNEFGDFSYEDNTGAVVTDGKGVYAIGTVSDGSGNWDWLLTAVNSSNGATLWQSQFGVTNRLEDANAMALSGRRLFVAGYEDNGVDSAADWLTCAYDTRSGVLLWTNRFANTNGFNVPFAMCTDGSRVYSVGQANNGFAVRSCNAVSGATLWQDIVTPIVGPDWGTAIATDGGNVYAAGETYEGGLHYDWLVRAYKGRNGKLMWQDKFNSAGLQEDAIGVTAAGGKLYAVGLTEDATTNVDWLVKAYDANSGSVIWTDRVDKAGGFDEATLVAMQGSLVCVAGISDVGGTNNPDDYHWLVRAYNAKTGAVLWEDSSRSVGGLAPPKNIALVGSNLCVAGSVDDSMTGSDWLLRVYDTKTGGLAWENQYDRGTYWDDERGMAAGPKGVYMFGLTTDGQSYITDWMVRGYQLK